MWLVFLAYLQKIPKYSPLNLSNGIGFNVGDEGGLLEGHGSDVMQTFDLGPQQDVQPRGALADAELVFGLDCVLTGVGVATWGRKEWLCGMNILRCKVMTSLKKNDNSMKDHHHLPSFSQLFWVSLCSVTGCS